jgi:ADP-heptose:LPS heptosyltransferase
MPKILIIRFSSIGDIVLTTPVIRNIRKQVPEAEIHYCTKNSFKGILENNPYVSKVHVLKDSFSDLISDLKKENFDFVVDLHNNLRSWRIKMGLGKPSATFNKLNIRKWLYVNLKWNTLPDVHIVERYMEAAMPLGVENDFLGLDYFIPSTDEISLETLPETHQQGYIAFAIGGQYFTKRLPEEKIIEFCEKINSPIVLLGGKEDVEAGKKIEAHFSGKGNNMIYNGCGLYTLNQSASLVKKSKMVFTHDTGLMHIAAAFKKEIYIIWGNTTPSLGMYPYLTKYHNIENNDLSCRPCSKIGYTDCPKGHFKCMVDLQPYFKI